MPRRRTPSAPGGERRSAAQLSRYRETPVFTYLFYSFVP
jgi:hypothetical protein